jgi:hypothetical protein
VRSRTVDAYGAATHDCTYIGSVASQPGTCAKRNTRIMPHLDRHKIQQVRQLEVLGRAGKVHERDMPLAQAFRKLLRTCRPPAVPSKVSARESAACRVHLCAPQRATRSHDTQNSACTSARTWSN